MNLSKSVAVLAVMTCLAACGSRDWRANQGKGNLNKANANGEQSPSVVAGASLKVSVGEDEGKATVSVVMSQSCEQFEGEIVLKGNATPVPAKVTNGTSKGSFDSRCVGVDGNCDRVVVAFTHNQDHSDVVFQKNQYGNYSVVGYPESDEFLSGRNAQCVAQAQPDSKTPVYSDGE